MSCAKRAGSPDLSLPQVNSFCFGQEEVSLLQNINEERHGERPWKTASGLGRAGVFGRSSQQNENKNSSPPSSTAPRDVAANCGGDLSAASRKHSSAQLRNEQPSEQRTPSLSVSTDSETDPAVFCGCFFQLLAETCGAPSETASRAVSPSSKTNVVSVTAQPPSETAPIRDSRSKQHLQQQHRQQQHRYLQHRQKPRQTEAPTKAPERRAARNGGRGKDRSNKSSSATTERRRRGSVSKICDFEADADESALNKISLEYSYEEVKAATDGFRRLLGIGAYGAVYHGFMRDGIEVAVKRLNDPSEAGFEREVVVLSKFRHPNLVILLGFARHGKDRFLIYEMMAGGDVAGHLERGTLTWFERVCIALDTAIALSHLHRHCPTVYHRDIKTSNILLDKHKTAKVSDFGLACLAKKKTGKFAVRQTAGTVGYADPKYIASSFVSEKTEVYSLGMVMLELMTAKAPAVLHPDGSVTYVLSPLAKDLPRLLREADMRANFPPTVLRFFADLGTSCIHDDEHRRPTFQAIVGQLRSLKMAAMSVTVDPEPLSFHEWRRHAQWHVFDALLRRPRQTPPSPLAPQAGRMPGAVVPRPGLHCCDRRPPRMLERGECQLSPEKIDDVAASFASANPHSKLAAVPWLSTEARGRHALPPEVREEAALRELKVSCGDSVGQARRLLNSQRQGVSASKNNQDGEVCPPVHQRQLQNSSDTSHPKASAQSSVCAATIRERESGGANLDDNTAVLGECDLLPSSHMHAKPLGVDGGAEGFKKEEAEQTQGPSLRGRSCTDIPASCLANCSAIRAAESGEAGASREEGEQSVAVNKAGALLASSRICWTENARPQANALGSPSTPNAEAISNDHTDETQTRACGATPSGIIARSQSVVSLRDDGNKQAKDLTSPRSRHVVESQIEIEREELRRHLEMQQRQLSLHQEELDRIHSHQRMQRSPNHLLPQERMQPQSSLRMSSHSDAEALQSTSLQSASAEQAERASTAASVSPRGVRKEPSSSASFLSGPPASMSCVSGCLRCDPQNDRKTPSHGRRRRHKQSLISEGECRLVLKQQQRRLRGCTDSSVSTMTNGGSMCSIQPSSGNLYSRSSNSWNSCNYSNNSIQSSASVVADRMWLYAEFLGEASSPQSRCSSGKTVPPSHGSQTTPSTTKSLKNGTLTAAAAFAVSSCRTLRTVAPLSRVAGNNFDGNAEEQTSPPHAFLPAKQPPAEKTQELKLAVGDSQEETTYAASAASGGVETSGGAEEESLQQKQPHLSSFVRISNGALDTSLSASEIHALMREAASCGFRRVLTGIPAHRQLVERKEESASSSSQTATGATTSVPPPASEQDSVSFQLDKDGSWLRRSSVSMEAGGASLTRGGGGTLPTILVSSFSENVAAAREAPTSSVTFSKKLFRTQQQSTSNASKNLRRDTTAAGPKDLEKLRAFF